MVCLDDLFLMYDTQLLSKRCVAEYDSVNVCVSAATCCIALQSAVNYAVPECTVHFRSTEVAEHSPETCVISTEVISCS